ncbi:MAG TPA: beta-xylosidase [Bacillota bacterium]|nr:beta-xylosidase [Bacillota bacterium]
MYEKISILWLGVMLIQGIIATLPVPATTTLTVNCGTVLRGATHCASGSLYGVTETLPSDIAGMVAPLNPCVFINPARAGSGYQQPIGAAIPVAGRLRSTTGKVMIRLADIYPGWPYQFTNMTDFLNKVTSVINDKKASGYSNFYGYEIWNEPDGTWNSGNGDFNSVLWKQTYTKIRSLDSGAQIIGPSYSYYDHNWMNTFLSYCKNNSCLPEVICWHELGGPANIANHINDYRAIESSLGVSARKISINEYCDSDHTLEGQPGSSARFFGKFERFKVDSACISWWFVPLPGRLGSLLTGGNAKGAGWYFYKWYGDMAGNMVSTTAPNENSNNMDGCACVNGNTVTVLFGGPNDGACAVKLNSLPSGIGSTANVLVQRVDWSSKDNSSSGPITVSQSNYTVSGGSITVTVSGTNGSSGYRLHITAGSGGGNTPTPTVIC